MKVFIVLSAVIIAVTAIPTPLVDPIDLALVLNEEEFEDYLDAWLAVEEPKWVAKSTRTTHHECNNNGCTLKVNGDLGEPQPLYLRDGNYILPTANTGEIHLEPGEDILLACVGSGRTIAHSDMTTTTSTAWATCEHGTTFSGAGWLNSKTSFDGILCSSHPYYDAEYTGQTCYNNNKVIQTGYIIDNEFYPIYTSCFDPLRYEVLYVVHEMTPQNAVHQTGVSRPSWRAGTGFFTGLGIDGLYEQKQQKLSIAKYVGEELTEAYVANSQYLARGHLAAKTDFVFAFGQRATFFFHNAAPQWQSFNNGNWNNLEQYLRSRIGAAGYHTTVYSGTYGVTQLRDSNGTLVDIYLYTDDNNNPGLPVPQYFYKVVYDKSLKLGTAFIGINNPYYTEEEVKKLTFCPDQCRNNSDFDWIKWQPDRIDYGYAFCCDINDFRNTVPYLPEFEVKGLLV